MTVGRGDDRGPLVAVVGCDGSGKSTVGAAVLSFARCFGPAEAVHLGKQSGNLARGIVHWPIIGRALGRTIKHQGEKARGVRGVSNPKLVGALVAYAFVIRRRRRFDRMLRRWHSRTIIVADRFPQMDVPGAYDGPVLLSEGGGSRIARWLARREHAQFTEMTACQPDLVLRLNVDLETAVYRKPDHKREALRRKILATPRFGFGGAPIVEIDSTRPLGEVVAAAEAAVEKVLLAHGYARRVAGSTRSNSAAATTRFRNRSAT
jgi:thymidylate kinase